MTVWFTSDQHFGHANVIKYCHRPFETADEMDEELIYRWNIFVQPDDVVYHLGDFTLGNNAEKYFSQLNGKVRVLANLWHHDSRWLRDLSYVSMGTAAGIFFNETAYVTKSGFVQLLPPIHILDIPNDKSDGWPLPIVMCHYPLGEWDRKHYGAIHLHGHSHGNYHAEGRIMDVGVDSNEYHPISLDTILERFL